MKGVGREVFQPWSWKSTGSVLWNHSLYDTKVWVQLLQRELGDINLIDTATDPLVPKVRHMSIPRFSSFFLSLVLILDADLEPIVL